MKCGRGFEHAGPKDKGVQPYDGLMFYFHATGNYGSTIFDPGYGNQTLIILICDDCVENHQEQIVGLGCDGEEIVSVSSLIGDDPEDCPPTI